MLDKFLKNINLLLNQTDRKILIAVSGGIDSMVMLDLFMNSDFEIGIAHCNFNLRGDESDEDERFIRNIANDNNIMLFVNSFNTAEYAKQNGLSIQMAARELRYNWFIQLLNEHGYQKIALAHNLDDKIETFFLNLMRGTGLKGIKGMRASGNDIIRPILEISRSEIKDYATKNHIKYREDSSNASIKYLRNKIRHEVLPVLKECEPSFLKIMNDNMQRFDLAWEIYKEYIDTESNKIIENTGKIIRINISELKQNKNIESFAPYNFTQSVIGDILLCLDNQPGKQFFSPTHRCIKDRKYLIISKIEHTTIKKYYLEKDESQITKPISLSFNIEVNSPDFKINKSRYIAYLDYDKLIFPLILRKWEKGDFFQPLGMSGIKKVSDFFSDNKLSLYDKENTWIISSGEKIVWIVGYRIDDRYKITGNTKDILKITFSL